LSTWDDGGWGNLVKQGKYRDNRFSDDLVTACAAMIKEWHPSPMPTWVTCIPSLRHPTLVPDFAKRLAQKLNLPFHLVLDKSEDRPEQKTMENSSQQAKNVDGSLKLSGRIPAGSAFLVDDMVDSRWTLTVATWLLRSHGCGVVFPLVLADTGNSDD
jgi:ATP-dependent DNA helicase RecQ